MILKNVEHEPSSPNKQRRRIPALLSHQIRSPEDLVVNTKKIYGRDGWHPAYLKPRKIQICQRSHFLLETLDCVTNLSNGCFFSPTAKASRRIIPRP
jgi:hypothetical protein